MDTSVIRDQLVTALSRGDREGLEALVGQLQPADLALAAREIDRADQIRLLAMLDSETAARLMEELEFEEQTDLLIRMPKERAAQILSEMSSDDIVDLLGDLPRGDSEKLLHLLPADSAQEIRELLVYPENTAGGLMTPEFVSLRRDMTAQEAIEFLRTQAPEAETIYYLYVTDERGRLIGVVSLRQLLTADPNRPVEDIMYKRVISVQVDTDQEEVARILDKYDFLAVPVVDRHNVLLGVVTVDDVIDVLSEEVTEDFQRMGGSEPLDQPYFSASLFTMVQKRIGWLFFLFLAQSLTGTILAHFEAQLAAVIALAFFIPMLTGTAGNAGSQAATLVIRSMALGEVRFGDFFRVMRRELSTGFVLGGIMAGLTFLRAYFFSGPPELGYTVALTILVVVAFGAVMGGTLPLIMRKLKLDPAVASGPVVTTIADATGLIIYFKIAQWLMGI